MILDTTFVIDIMKNEEKATAKLNELIRKGEPQLITALTIFELFSGITRSSKPREEKTKIMKIVGNQIVLHLENSAAEKAGDVHGTLVKEGNMIDPVDSMIAGIALIKKEKVLTRNVKDFKKVKELELETY